MSPRVGPVRARRHPGAGWFLVALLGLSGGCSRAIQPTIGDVTLAFAVRTAIVNDATVGAALIDVTAREGVVTLSGLVATPAERERALALARRVAGVVRVDDRLRVSAAQAAVPAPDPSALPALPPEEPPPPGRHIAVGAAFTVPTNVSRTLDASVSLSPVFRFGRGGGWHPVVTWTRIRSNLPPTTEGAEPFGELRMSAVTGGIGYCFTGGRLSVNPAISGGYSFNHIRLDPGFVVPRDKALPVAVSGSPTLVAGASLWVEATRHVSVGVAAGYLISRPNSTWLNGDRFEPRRLKADVWVAGISVAYWIF